MAIPDVFGHLLFAGVLFALSAVLTRLMIGVRVLAVPNDRSSHSAPVPNGGGTAIVATFLAGYGALYLLVDDARIGAPYMIGFLVGCLGIAAVGFLDDLGRLRTFRVKLLTQVVGAVVLVSFDIAFRHVTIPVVGAVDLGWWGYPLTVVWLVALMNIVNFMDGLDGLAAGTAAIAAFFFALITFLEGSYFVYFVSIVLLASTLGFFVFNFPRARIFMGDVGSQFLGFCFAAMAVIAAEHDASATSLLVMPLLFFHFIFDCVFTFLRRVRSGEPVTQAHRSHLYQLLNRLGASHPRVTLIHCAMATLQGIGALVLIEAPDDARMVVFGPFLVAASCYAAWVLRRARSAGNLGR
jgi:UDP-GlcNAc:undecaprenyl-phosphate GlcNAc-1-phosphate transferase